MRALGIGGSGFIGSHLVDELLGAGARVRVFDRMPERYRSSPAGIDFRPGEFHDTASLAEALVQVDVVFHLVSTTVPSTSNLDPIADIQGNLINSVRLLELMRAAGVRRLVYLSSGGTVYGIPQADPVVEGHPLRPISSYGVVKVAVENYIMMERHLHGLRPVILRASNPYGPRQGHGGVQGVVGTYLSNLACGEPLELWGDGSVVRDFIHVRDLARLCRIAAASDVDGVYNAGSGEGQSIAGIIETICSVTGREPDIIRKPSRGFDVPRVVLDMTASRAAFGEIQSTSLYEGIAETWDWLRG